MAETTLQTELWEGGVYQGETAADIAMEYGYAPTRTYVDPSAKAHPSAEPSTFPKVSAPRHQHARGPDDEAALCSGQTPCAELIARRHELAQQDAAMAAAQQG